MKKDVIKKIIIENQERIKQLEILDRRIQLEQEANYIFTGQRRAGKTFLIYTQIKKRISEGKNPAEILYINFEDERLLEFNSGDFDMIIDSFKELYAMQPVLFFDEIQNVDGWQQFARRMADSNYRIFITGSNAKMLSAEMASTLGGRFLIKEIDTLNFKEFLTFKGIEIKKDYQFTSQRFEIRKQFEEYFYFGGFPELLKYQDKKEYLNTIFQKVFLGDIIARNNIRNAYALHLMVKKLAESTMDEVSFNRIKNIINSTGIKVGTATLLEYIRYLEDAFLIKSIYNFKQKITERETKKKYYFRDHGLLGLFLSTPESYLLENIAFNHLYSQYKEELFFVRENFELDFYVPDKMAIQVCYNLKQIETKQREINGLIKASKSLQIKDFLIVTVDEEFTIEEEGIAIKVVPVWKWLLQGL